MLVPLFERYAAGDSAGMNRKKESTLTMSQAEFMQFLADSNLIDKKLTGRECKALFIRVNVRFFLHFSSFPLHFPSFPLHFGSFWLSFVEIGSWMMS